MARYRRRDAIETRLSDRLEAEGRAFTADLIAKRATGVEGYRTTLAFLEIEDSTSLFVELEPANSRDEVQRRAESLREDVDRLRALLAKRLSSEGDAEEGTSRA